MDDVLAGIANCNYCRRTLVAEVGNDSGAVDQRSNVMIRQGLDGVSSILFTLISVMKTYQNWSPATRYVCARLVLLKGQL